MLDCRLDLVRGLRIPRHVQRGSVGVHGVLSSLEGTEDSVDLPASQDCAAGTACRKLFPTAEGEFILIGKLEVVGDVEVRGGAVAVEHAQGVPREFRPVRILGVIDGPGISISAFEEQTARKAPVDGGLQRVIVAVHTAIILPGCRSASELGIERLPIKAGAGDLRGVDVQEPKAFPDPDPTYPTEVTSSPGNLCSRIKFHDWM